MQCEVHDYFNNPSHTWIYLCSKKNKKTRLKVFTVFIKQLVPKHLHNKHPSEHEAGLETNPRAQTKLTSPQTNFTSRRTKALEKFSYKHDGVSSHSYMNIFQLICEDHMVLFSNKNEDERTHCPGVELQSSMEAAYIYLKSSMWSRKQSNNNNSKRRLGGQTAKSIWLSNILMEEQIFPLTLMR